MDKQALASSVNELVRREDAPRLFEYLSSLTKLPAHWPVCFSGHAAILNPLLELSWDNPDGYRSILDLIDERRKMRGLPSMRGGSTYNVNSYQREFMQNKRLRERRAADIENMMRRPSEQLKGTSRMEFMRNQSAKWKAARDEMLERARLSLNTHRLTREQMQELLTTFWQKIDNELDELERLARSEKMK